jgi:hypothetical protein
MSEGVDWIELAQMVYNDGFCEESNIFGSVNAGNFLTS